MPSQTRSSSRLRSSAAKKIQKRFRSRKRKRSKASRKIQSRVRGKLTRKVVNREKNTMSTVHNCPICFEPMTEDVRIALPCGHRFHKDCIRQSLTSTRGKCPMCRTAVTNIPYVQEGRANRTFGNVPLSQQQPQAQQAPPAILDPTQRRQYILQRLREIELLEQRIAQLPTYPREIPNITINEALHIQYNARQIVDELRRIFYEASENYQNYRDVRTNGTLDQDVTNMYYITSDLLNRAQVIRNNATQLVDEIGGDETPDLM